ncbi:glycosyltransferase family 2 protein [Salinactinospora qingdaonensis]|uniref:Glycosyltransferase n=1 Tax=Salinactinospora qingdaonensis TaxID=702744 RepID=A0ABP7EX01_9ACTN
MSLAVVMPAYNEAANLAATVEDFLHEMAALGLRHWVVIVDDRSQDDTARIAGELATRHPNVVEVVHHPARRGYGAAVGSGIRAALERTDAEWVLLTDSDGQYRANAVPAFINTALRERADAVLGYRASRADPLGRKVNGVLWSCLSRLLLRTPAKDVDCAYKLIRRELLERMDLRGKAAEFSPELVAKLRATNGRIVQRAVTHLPRRHGQPTGADPAVIWHSLNGLTRVWWDVTVRGGMARLAQPRDPVLTMLTAAAVVLSVLAYLYFRPASLAYPDSVSHLVIARRVVAASTPGLAQLGGVWLPLPHLLALPFIWLDSWYRSGLAGAVVSMASYVVAVRYLYRTAVALTGYSGSGVVAATLFALCPAVLYLQSTPMSELLMAACVVAAVYHLTRWCQGESSRHLAATAAASLLGTLTRYETWCFTAAVLATVGIVAWQRAPVGQRLHRTEAHVVFFAVLGCAGIAGWMVWNAVIFGDPLFFHSGDYAKPSLWVSQDEATVGDWATSTLTYLYAIVGVAGAFLPVLAGAGLVAHLLRQGSLAPLTLLVFPPFIIVALYSGQRPLHVEQITGDLYNVRFALIVMLPIAVFTATLAAEVLRLRVRWPRQATAALVGATAVAVSAVGAAGSTEPDVLREAREFQFSATERASARAAAWLRDNYDGGTVLMQSFGNETVMFDARLPLNRIVYEGSYRAWEPTLADPKGNGVRWIHMRHTPGKSDQVWKKLGDAPALEDYTRVYADRHRFVYRAGEP